MPWPKPKTISTWGDLLSHYRGGGPDRWKGWMFRGQGRASWNVESSLERLALRRFGLPRTDLKELERKLIRDFQRQAHLFHPESPDLSDRLAWLALMQHHGAPTRLLDWSYSFYAAAFFAIADARPGQVCTIWAIDYRWCRREVHRLAVSARGSPQPRSPEKLLFMKPTVAGLYPVNPFPLHQRLAVQQGVFLAPGDPTRTFLQNFRRMNSRGEKPIRRINVKCSRRLLTAALRDLRRMNVTYASLFPGLDGFAKNLGNMIPVLHEIPDDDQP